LDGGSGINELIDWAGKHKHSKSVLKTVLAMNVSPCASWTKGFVTALGGDSGKSNPNGKIKITLPSVEDEKHRKNGHSKRR
jgi:hypothetical protein